MANLNYLCKHGVIMSLGFIVAACVFFFCGNWFGVLGSTLMLLSIVFRLDFEILTSTSCLPEIDKSELISFLTISGSQADQLVALNFLQQAARTNFPEFVKQISIVLSSTDVEPLVRQQSGLQLKNLLYAKDAETLQQNHKRWIDTPEDIRNTTKQNVLRTLGTETVRPSIAAQCINAIAGIELPFQQWVEVIEILMSNVANDSSPEKLKDSSLEALGYICQDVNASTVEIKSNQIVTAIVHGMRQQEPSALVRLSATEAMLNALDVTKNNFANTDERNVIMRVVCEATLDPDTRIRVAALQCLVRIVSLYYNHIDRYMKEALFAITVDAMQSVDNNVSLQGIEFWSNVCEKELFLARVEIENICYPSAVNRHYSNSALQTVLSTLLETFSKLEEYNNDKWIPAVAAGECINLLAQGVRDDIVEVIASLIQDNLKNSDYRSRVAGISTFVLIFDSTSTTKLIEFGAEVMKPLLSLLTDSNDIVRDTTAWAIGSFFKKVEEVELCPNLFSNLVNELVKLTQDDLVSRTATSALSKLRYTAHSMKDNDFQVIIDNYAPFDEKNNNAVHFFNCQEFADLLGKRKDKQ